jgi:hypothetical protein
VTRGHDGRVVPRHPLLGLAVLELGTDPDTARLRLLHGLVEASENLHQRFGSFTEMYEGLFTRGILGRDRDTDHSQIGLDLDDGFTTHRHKGLIGHIPHHPLRAPPRLHFLPVTKLDRYTPLESRV